ncbi:MAG: GspH/FimT family pseudopilin [Candidatus Rokuibacteriota bacterium]
MTRQRGRQAGYSLIELVIVGAMISIVASFAMPSFLNYYRSAKVRAAAQTLSAILNQGRQLAIKDNLTAVAVCITTTTMQFRQPDCSGASIPVAGLTGASNNINAPDGINLTTSGNATFTKLGNAAPGATYTVTDPASGRTLSVIVAASGRIALGP